LDVRIGRIIRCRLKVTVTTCVLAAVLVAVTACGDGTNGDGRSSEPRKAACKGCYQGHGVSFNYPPTWQKTEDTTAPLSRTWLLRLRLDKQHTIQLVGRRESELEFPPSNLAAGKSGILDELKVFDVHAQPGSEKLTVDGRPGLRFRATQSVKGKPFEITILITFKGKTQYLLSCTRPEGDSEFERGCAEIVRTFNVENP
jgi:hypothetical protein